MSEPKQHVTVCICTYKRPAFLKRLLDDLLTQDTFGEFTYSIVITDNDPLCSAQAVVLEFVAEAPVPVKYCVEPQQNIARARNTAVENASGDFIAFIDDDEFPAKRWLHNLFSACRRYEADGVLGPVKRHFDEEPPRWVRKGKFYDRPTYPTGLVIDWLKGRTGNVLLKRHIFAPGEQAFNPAFRAGSDQDFFRRMIEQGHRFIWCNEAVAYEVVPPIRWKRTFMMKRALLSGATSILHPTFRPRTVAKSIVAVLLYAVALPAVLALGQHRFMDCLLRLLDHLGLLLAALGFNPIRKQYITE